MTAARYRRARDYMVRCMQDRAHDRLHVGRVLNYALIIARDERQEPIDRDVLILAALLHDIARPRQEAGEGCHALLGSRMAAAFLREEGYPPELVSHVADCIATHRFKKGGKPRTLEAKILYDADKLNLIGGVGVARAILFGGQIGEPLYTLDDSDLPCEEDAAEPSLLREYGRKLSGMADVFYTEAARALAKNQQRTMDRYFHGLIGEVSYNHAIGGSLLEDWLD